MTHDSHGPPGHGDRVPPVHPYMAMRMALHLGVHRNRSEQEASRRCLRRIPENSLFWGFYF